jgi:hypothetical protein
MGRSPGSRRGLVCVHTSPERKRWDRPCRGLYGVMQALSVSDGITPSRYPAVSLWKRAGLMPNTRLNAREN